MQHTLDHFLVGGSFFKLWLPSLVLVYSLVSIGPPMKEGISQAVLESSSIFREACEGELLLLEILVTQQTLRQRGATRSDVCVGRAVTDGSMLGGGGQAVPVDPRALHTNDCDGSEEQLL